MIDDVGDFARRQTYVYGYKNGAKPQRAEVAFEHSGQVGNEEGHSVALAYPGLPQRGREAANALVELSVRVAGVAVYDGRFVGIDGCASLKQREGAERFERNGARHVLPPQVAGSPGRGSSDNIQ